MIKSVNEEKIRHLLFKDGNIDKLLKRMELIHPIDIDPQNIPFEAENVNSGVILKSFDDNSYPNILIHIKSGEACTEQVYDAIYNYDTSFLARFILYTDNYISTERCDPSVDENVVASLINTLNEYPLNLHLIKLDNEALISGEISFEEIEAPRSKKLFSVDDIPTKKELIQTEFWSVFYEFLCGESYVPREAFFKGIDIEANCGVSFECSYAHIIAAWVEDGFLYEIESDEGYAEKVLKRSTQFIESKLLPVSKIRMEAIPGEKSIVDFTLFDMPLKSLFSMNNREKMELAMMIHSRLMTLQYFLDGF